MGPDEPGAILMLVDENRTFIDQNDHTFLVIHKTASGGSAQNIATFFANDPNKASTHYIVGQDGAVVQAVLEKDGAAGNCCVEDGFASFLTQYNPLHVGGGGATNLNTMSVSLEHVDPASDNSTPLTDAQKAASFRLIQHICERHNIPKRRATNDGLGGIIGHMDIDPINRAHCPGNYPWQELFTYLQGGTTTMGVPAGWHDDGTTLTAPNGVKVVHGFRDYVLAHNWDPGNVPLAAEFGTSLLESSNPSLGGGSQQLFNWTMLGYTAARGVFVEWGVRELAFCRQQVQLKAAQIGALDAQIAQLKADLAKATAPVPTIQGIDPVKVKAFLQAAGAKVADLETFITSATFS